MRQLFHIVRVACVAVSTCCAGALVGCTDPMYDNSPAGPLELSVSVITVGREGGTAHVGVTARGGGWTVEGAPEWMVLDKTNGSEGISTLAVTFEAWPVPEVVEPEPEPEPELPEEEQQRSLVRTDAVVAQPSRGTEGRSLSRDLIPRKKLARSAQAQAVQGGRTKQSVEGPTTRAGEDELEPRKATLVFSSGGVEKTITITQLPTELTPPVQSAEKEVNESVHKELLNVWYYNGETRTAAADYNQTYRDFYENYLSNLRGNLLDGNVWSRVSERYLYSFIERNPVGTAAANQPRLNYGMEFELTDFNGQLVGRVLYVDEGGAAQTAGLKRGDWFHRVDGIRLDDYDVSDVGLKYKFLYNRLIDTLVHPVANLSQRLGMLTFRSYALELVDEGREVTLTPTNHRANPILHSSTIVREHVSGGMTRTGYLVYNSFDPAFESELIAKFSELWGASEEPAEDEPVEDEPVEDEPVEGEEPASEQGSRAKQSATRAEGEPLTHFILDLRYNHSGSVEMAELVGNLLVPEAARGMTFARYEFPNGDAAAENRTVTFEPHASGAGVATVIILTSPRTAGPAELLINALRGIDPTVKLIVVGDVTEGMNVGMVHRTHATPEWEYDVWMSSFRVYNAAGQGDYQYGLIPNTGTTSEWSRTGVVWSDTWGWKGQAGRTEDPLLQRALDFVIGATALPNSRVMDGPARERSGYPREFSVPTTMTADVGLSPETPTDPEEPADNENPTRR